MEEENSDFPEDNKLRYQPGPQGARIIEQLCKQVVQFEGQSTEIESTGYEVRRGMGELALRAGDQLESLILGAPDEQYGQLMREYIEGVLSDLRERRDKGESFFPGL